MIRLLIADDEKIIRETLNTIIDWTSMNIEVVALCKNGLEAYDAILDLYPDIVLTDIRMPKLSGLELIHKITQNYDNIQFIILSGYSDFSYAKEAMGYGIRHYITKPCNENEIIHSVNDAIKEHYHELYLNGLNAGLTTGLFLGENIMSDLLLHLLSSYQEINSTLSMYETYLDFFHTPYQLCYIYFLEEYLVTTCIEKIQMALKQNRIHASSDFIYVKNTLLFFFIDSKMEYHDFDNSMHLIEFSNQNVSCSYKRTSFPDLQLLLTTVERQVKRYETIYLYIGKKAITICNYDNLFQKVLELGNSLTKNVDRTAHHYKLQELKTILASVKDIELLRSLVNILLLKSVQTSTIYTTSDITEFMLFIGSITSNKEICSFIFDKIDKIFSYPITLDTHKYKPFIQDILNYTREHISIPELTLKWIVENHLYMNVDYVSRQFVLQTGIKFSDYLNQLRVEKAKQLLINKDTEKIYQVAEQVGCGNNPQYFSHLFKKYTKMTPKDYIRKMK